MGGGGVAVQMYPLPPGRNVSSAPSGWSQGWWIISVKAIWIFRSSDWDSGPVFVFRWNNLVLFIKMCKCKHDDGNKCDNLQPGSWIRVLLCAFKDPLSAFLKCLYSESYPPSSCHYLFFSQKKMELEWAESRAASCKAAGKDLCHSLPCRWGSIHLSVSVFSLQRSPPRSLSGPSAVVPRNKSTANGSRTSSMKKHKTFFASIFLHSSDALKLPWVALITQQWEHRKQRYSKEWRRMISNPISRC